jgi:hypothetical protein
MFELLSTQDVVRQVLVCWPFSIFGGLPCFSLYRSYRTHLITAFGLALRFIGVVSGIFRDYALLTRAPSHPWSRAPTHPAIVGFDRSTVHFGATPGEVPRTGRLCLVHRNLCKP